MNVFVLPLRSKRMKRADKNGKGLRHFSMKVCEKVQKKGTTSYNEVADELVAEFTHASSLMPTDSVSILRFLGLRNDITQCRCHNAYRKKTRIVSGFQWRSFMITSYTI